MTTTSTAELELSIYSHNQSKVTLHNKKCTLCNKANSLMRLTEEFQEFAAQKGYDSYFCTNCINVVNFILNNH